MITFVRSATANDGKFPDGLKFATTLAKYMTSDLGIKIEVTRNVGGPVNQLHWVGRFESLSEYSDAMKKIVSDPGYQKRLSDVADQHLFAANSLFDHLYESVS